jgi:hypothetical protein
MPYYYITVSLYDGRVIKGVKENADIRIDIVYRIYLAESEKHFRASQIKEYECMMISRQSPIYKDWIKKKQFKKGMLGDAENNRIELERNKNAPFTPVPRRKDQMASTQHWGENIKKQNEI